MIQPVPVGDFNFLTKKEVKKFDLDSISDNSEIGYILEVDLEYCKELHDLHNDYPLCPEKIEVNSNMLSRYCIDIANKYKIKVGGVKKLIPNLVDKIKYIAHYRNLQYYLSLGMKLTKIHKILKVRQSNWLKEYVEFNTTKDKKVLMNLIKLILNLCLWKKYGKYQKKNQYKTKMILKNISNV